MTEISLAVSSFALTACLILASIIAWRIYSRQWSDDSPPRGCRRLGIQTSSNLADEYSSQYSGATPPQPGLEGQIVGEVKAVYIYPIKSCARIELAQGDVVKTGLKYDRQFVFAEWTAEKQGKGCWKFITQRTHPMLTQVQSEVWIPDESVPTYSEKETNVRSNGVIILRIPYSGGSFWAGLRSLSALIRKKQPEDRTVRLPFNPTPEQIHENEYTLEEVKVWNSQPAALLIASTNSLRPQRWIKDLQYFLDIRKPLALFRVANGCERQPKSCAPTSEDLGYASVIGFADSYPMHILNLASVHDLAGKQHSQAPKLSALQFRANIYITGPEAYAEDHWKRIRIGNSAYCVVCRTTRCKLPNVNQNTGFVDVDVKGSKGEVQGSNNVGLEVRGAEPEAAMRKTRRIDQGAKLKSCMGMMMVPAAQFGSIKVGDPIELLATGEHFYVN